MIDTSHLLDKIASLTAIRNLEILEVSLIETIQELLCPRGVSIIKLDMKHAPKMEIVFDTDHCLIRYENINVSDPIKSAVALMLKNRLQEHGMTHNSSNFFIYYIIETSSVRTFLIIRSEPDINYMNSHMVKGLIQIYRNFCNLLLYSQTDLLTGLANRKTFDECILRVYDLAPSELTSVQYERRSKEPMFYWLAMIDIDHFKIINDKFGHMSGDQVLILLSQTLRAVFREDDMVFRFGGEEFVAILRCQDREGCNTALERLRKTVETRNFPDVGRVTVSIGATMIQRGVYSMLLDNADRALYHSKNSGRNRTTIFEDLLEMGIVSMEK